MAEPPPWGWRIGWPPAALAGPLAVAAAVAGTPFLLPRDGVLAAMALCAVATAFLLGLLAERVLRRAPVTSGVGALAGVAVALLSHPGMAVVFGLVSVAIGEQDAGDLPAGVAGVTVLSLLYWSWVTVPLGLLGGLVAGTLVTRHHARRHRTDA